MILQGHCNLISCCAVSSDKRWIVTADTGEDPIMVVWDSMTGAPVKTFYTPHTSGVKALDISDDGKYIATLSEPVDSVRIYKSRIETLPFSCVSNSSPANLVFFLIIFSYVSLYTG
jgi:WD40 repeat protein